MSQSVPGTAGTENVLHKPSKHGATVSVKGGQFYLADFGQVRWPLTASADSLTEHA